MADSERTTTLPVSRRRLLAGAGVAALAGAASIPVAGSIPHPDAALLALAVDLERAWEEEKKLGRDAPDDPPQDAFDRLFEVSKAIVRRIIITPASTLDGLKVKALAIRWCYCDDLAGVSDIISGDTTDRKLAASIICDLVCGLSPEMRALGVRGAA